MECLNFAHNRRTSYAPHATSIKIKPLEDIGLHLMISATRRPQILPILRASRETAPMGAPEPTRRSAFSLTFAAFRAGMSLGGELGLEAESVEHGDRA
jgi:hypothetical protein